MKRETICALCTAEGKSALSLIRISGPKALEITRELASFLPEKPESHRAYFGELKQENKFLDQVLVTYFKEGHSFTGEESLEISCHGGEVYKDLLKALFDKGARPARRGEFSMQAFSNGKMDLVQAEGLLQLIESENESSRQQALFQLKGSLSQKLKHIEEKWLFLLSHLEADIDFSLEDLNSFTDQRIKQILLELKAETEALLLSYCPFEKIQKGLCFGIFGPVNSGKSSLLNALLGEEKAIVSSEEGTTRDLVEVQLANPLGLGIHLKDSAGFRWTQSEGEQKGQQKARELFDSCDYRLLLFDFADLEKVKKNRFLFSKPATSLLVFTKKDLAGSLSKKDLIKTLGQKMKIPSLSQVFFISSLTREGLELLREKIFSYGKLNKEDFVLSNYRHYKGLNFMNKVLINSLSILEDSQGEKDLIAQELKEGLSQLYEILGKKTEDQLLDSIFKQFCIGK